MKKTIISVLITALMISASAYSSNPGNDNLGYIELAGTSNINHFTFSNRINYKDIETFVSQDSTTNNKQVQHVLKVRVSNFVNPNKGLQKDFHQLLQSDVYPFINIKLEHVIIQNKNLQNNKINLRVIISISGVQKNYELSSHISAKYNDIYELTGKQTILLSDFGIQAPVKFFGLVKVNNSVEVNFAFNINYSEICTYEVQHKNPIRIKSNVGDS